MPAIIEAARPSPARRSAPLWKRLAWFFGLAVAAPATAVVAYALRALPFAG